MRANIAQCRFGYGVLVKGVSLSYHNKETKIFTIDSYYDNLN